MANDEKIMTVKELIRISKLNWLKAEYSNPAFKQSGQTEYTYENYEKLIKKAKDFEQTIILIKTDNGED